MSSMGAPVVVVSSILCGFVLSAVIKVFQELWWTPIRIQNLMDLQGITGPSYKLVHGNTKEIMSMKMKTMRSPRNLSNDILSTVQPHIQSWTKIFGNKLYINYVQF